MRWHQISRKYYRNNYPTMLITNGNHWHGWLACLQRTNLPERVEGNSSTRSAPDYMTSHWSHRQLRTLTSWTIRALRPQLSEKAGVRLRYTTNESISHKYIDFLFQTGGGSCAEITPIALVINNAQGWGFCRSKVMSIQNKYLIRGND